MTDYSHVFVDTAPFVYYLEQTPGLVNVARRFFRSCLGSQAELVTSVVTIEEFLVHPLRAGDHRLVENFYLFLDESRFRIVNVDRETAVSAARLRAYYPGYKGMDALQIACALRSGCSLFVTNDKQLRQTQEIRCVTLEEFAAGAFSAFSQ